MNINNVNNWWIRHTDRQADRQADRKTDRQSQIDGGLTDRKMSRQTDY